MGAADGRARGDDRGGAAVVPHGEVLVVWVEGVLGPAEHDAAVVGVVQADEEVGVVADPEGQVAFEVGEGQEGLLLQGGVVLEDIGEFGVFGEDALEVLADDGVDGAAQGGEGVQRGLGEDALVRLDGGQGGEAVVLGEGIEVEGVVADGDGDARGGAGGGGDDAKGDVGEREVRAAGDGEPRAEGRHGGEGVDEDGRRELRSRASQG